MLSKSKKFLAVVVLCVATTASHADVILSSYHRDPFFGIKFSSSIWDSFSFITGQEAYALDSVSMHLSSIVPGSVQVSLYSHSIRSFDCSWGLPATCTTPAPGSSLSTAGLQSVHAEGDYTFEFDERPVLRPDSIYWVVFQGLGDAELRYYEFGWQNLTDWRDQWVSETGAEVYQFARSPATYDRCLACGPEVTGIDWMVHSGVNLLQVNGTRVAEVPEPGTLPLLALGLAGVIGAWRFRRDARGL